MPMTEKVKTYNVYNLVASCHTCNRYKGARVFNSRAEVLIHLKKRKVCYPLNM